MSGTMHQEWYYTLGSLTSGIGLRDGAWGVDYDELLIARRQHIAHVNRAGYEKLSGGGA